MTLDFPGEGRRSPSSTSTGVGAGHDAGPDGARAPASSAYHAGLDGVRALAVAAVIVYHAGVSWAPGGFLGVEVFFVLSGFLITSLLLREWLATAGIGLTAFWGRRARRLLPALFCVVTVVGVYYAAAGPTSAVPGLKQDGIATLLYVGNWHQIAAGSGYFAANGPVSPLEHTWSLAIEEQFYILWPLLLVGTLGLVSRRARRGKRGPGQPSAAPTRRPLQVLLAVTLAGAVASLIDTAVQIRGGLGLDRVYYGTDTRAAGLLIGASLAIGLELARGRHGTRHRHGNLLTSAAFVAVLAIVALMALAAGGSTWLYPFGFIALDLAVVVLIATIVTRPASIVGRAFALRPMRAIGAISYGIYLWHFPLFLWLDAGSTGVSGTPLVLLRVAATLAVSVASFFVIERPVRRQQIPARLLRPLAPLAAAGALSALIVASMVGSLAYDATAAPVPLAVTSHLHGSDPPCRVTLKDTSRYGLSPLSERDAAREEPQWLASHQLKWSSTSRLTFTTCPPKRVLLIGDSIAFTLGVGLMHSEQMYGVEVANAAILGCGFNRRGDLFSVRARWESQSPGCPTALSQWAQDARALRAQAVIVELGYRDEFNWRIDGRVVHLGQPAFDAYVQQRIDRYVRTLAQPGVPVLLLSVPWVDPPALPDGSAAPAASPARRAMINAMLASAARLEPGLVRVLSIDQVISPGNRYRPTVDGKLCRFDGVHVTVFCSELLQPHILSAVRTMIDNASTTPPPTPTPAPPIR